MPRLLPLFPLQLVAFPGVAMPLHIFEPRYRQMVGEAEANGSEFGIVLARDGGVARAGCTVVVEQVLERFADGRFDVMTRGQRRFQIQSIDEELDYLRGEVEYFADLDEAPVAAGLRSDAILAWHELQKQTDTEFGGTPPDPDDPLLSFRLSASLGDLDAQSSLLLMQSESERLRLIISLVPKLVERRSYVTKMHKIGPTNGHGHKPADAG